MVKRIFSLNFFDSFIFGITTVAIPLLMLERGIDLAAIGLALSLAPIAKTLVRLVSAAVADAVGERAFYTLNGIANFIEAPIYYFSNSAGGFALGKAVDGARESFIWAVNRSSLISEKPEGQHYVLGGLVSGRGIYFALGSLAVGLLFPIGGFGILFALMGAIGLIMAALSFSVKNTKMRERVKLSDYTFLGRERRFYETVGAIMVGGTVYSFIVYFLLPIFFKLSGYSLGQIGFFYAVYFLIFGVVLNFSSHKRVSGRAAGIIGAFFFVIGLSGLALAETPILPFFFFLMAIGDSQLGLLWEQIIYLQVKSSRKRSTEVALLHTPSNVSLFLFTAVSGFAVQSFGFAPIFALGAASLVAFAAWSVRLVDEKI